MSNLAVEAAIVLALIIVNGVFAMVEIAVVSARRSRLEQQAKDGDVKARVALDLAENPNRFLSTVQVGITLVGIFAGAFGGATIAEDLADLIEASPALARYSDAIAIGIVVAAITFLTLILGELVPKRIGLNRPEAIARRFARPMHILAIVAKPIVHLLS